MKVMEKLLHRYRESENPLKTLRRLELGTLLLAVFVVVWSSLTALAVTVGGGPAPIPPADDTLRVKALGLEQPLDAESSEMVVERPLFWAGRRPIEVVPVREVAPAKPTGTGKLEGVTLHGVYGQGASLGAIATVDGRLTRISADRPVKGWRLVSYDEGQVTFEKGGRRQTLPLELTAPSVKVAATPKPAPAASDANTSQQQERKPAPAGDGLGFGGESARRKSD
jgi:hypothetical protein